MWFKLFAQSFNNQSGSLSGEKKKWFLLLQPTVWTFSPAIFIPHCFWVYFLTFTFWLTMVVLRSLSFSPPRPDTTLSSRPGGLVRNFPDKLRYRRRAALGEDRLADLRAGAGWWTWSPLMGCVILAVSALEESVGGGKQTRGILWVREKSGIWSLIKYKGPREARSRIHCETLVSKINHDRHKKRCIHPREQREVLYMKHASPLLKSAFAV